jgi:hypothetical protein
MTRKIVHPAAAVVETAPLLPAARPVYNRALMLVWNERSARESFHDTALAMSAQLLRAAERITESLDRSDDTSDTRHLSSDILGTMQNLPGNTRTDLIAFYDRQIASAMAGLEAIRFALTPDELLSLDAEIAAVRFHR